MLESGGFHSSLQLLKNLHLTKQHNLMQLTLSHDSCIPQAQMGLHEHTCGGHTVTVRFVCTHVCTQTHEHTQTHVYAHTYTHTVACSVSLNCSISRMFSSFCFSRSSTFPFSDTFCRQTSANQCGATNQHISPQTRPHIGTVCGTSTTAHLLCCAAHKFLSLGLEALQPLLVLAILFLHLDLWKQLL